MKKYFILLILCGTLVGCGKNDEIITEENKIESEPVDFVGCYKKDHNTVYFDGCFLKNYELVKLENSDSETFEHIAGTFFKDKNQLYFECVYTAMPTPPQIMNDVDIETLDLLSFDNGDGLVRGDNSGYIKDKNSFYHCSWNCEKVNDIDYKSFEVLNQNYAKDKNNIYYKNEKIINIDLESFEAFTEVYFNGYGGSEYYARDKDNCYHYGEIENISECNRIFKKVK
ncbi:MAG: DKNYY domain-containing protein [Candidatus Moranbacteria bacterium]|nr:DKNYY domain-containing protein [Candidatus Moranbacteria bacterium]